MLELVLIFAAGMAGSPHCAGTCSRLVTGLQRFPGPDCGLTRQLLYNAGRVVSYLGLGAGAGALGALLLGEPTLGRVTFTSFDPRALSLLCGAVIMLLAIALHERPLPMRERAAARVEQYVPKVLRSRSHLGSAGLGILSGLLPSPLVYAFAALALRTASPAAGMGIMLAFGLGTVPLMLALGLAGERPAPDWTRRGSLFSSKLILLLGAVVAAHGVLGAAAS